MIPCQLIQVYFSSNSLCNWAHFLKHSQKSLLKRLVFKEQQDVAPFLNKILFNLHVTCLDGGGVGSRVKYNTYLLCNWT